ncbi:MAG: hypothetical protein KGL69_02120, partial [Alphaproteobacteria bacterium]|nr:hypothetical protein [Alphaproteobacteria bacterium]
ACGHRLGPAALALWRTLGGADGRLGCPTADEEDAAPSSQGTRSRQVLFGETGAIFTHVSGPLSGQAFAIADCYRLYFQYGGPTGWLGLPTGGAEETPDGETQTYEGGVMRRPRATEACDPERAEAPMPG